ncbi:MFS transporter [Agromyces allii]|uniref:MFS transporter n=1 Tax=Agromyces allii TaxID=393607 RepID=A0ABP5BEW1_9MICO|nr:MFS transporter [Agromyces allii]
MTRPEVGTAGMLWRFAPMIYGPTLLFGLAEGALLPVLPVIATRLGATVPQAALIAAAIVVARMIGNLPAGWLVDRIGERYTMAVAGVAAMAGAVGILLAPNLVVLGVSVFGVGFCAAAFGLARHAFMTTRAPLAFRARALSLLGGSFRLGMFMGPFVAAALLTLFDDPLATAWFFIGCLVALVLLVLLGRDPESELDELGMLPHAQPHTASTPVSATAAPGVAGEREGVFATMWRFRGVLARLGLAAATLSGIRQARVYLLPIWGVSIALDAQTISLIVGVTGALEFALFYSSGQIMDRWGRLWASMPSMLVMGASFFVLAFTHDLPDATAWFLVAAIGVGIGNGLSSGVLMTLGADVAPRADPAAFLGSWRLLTDAGAAAAPLLIAGVSAIASLSVATGLIGVIGLLGAVGFWRAVPRYVPHRARR